MDWNKMVILDSDMALRSGPRQLASCWSMILKSRQLVTSIKGPRGLRCRCLKYFQSIMKSFPQSRKRSEGAHLPPKLVDVSQKVEQLRHCSEVRPAERRQAASACISRIVTWANLLARKVAWQWERELDFPLSAPPIRDSWQSRMVNTHMRETVSSHHGTLVLLGKERHKNDKIPSWDNRWMLLPWVILRCDSLITPAGAITALFCNGILDPRTGSGMPLLEAHRRGTKVPKLVDIWSLITHLGWQN